MIPLPLILAALALLGSIALDMVRQELGLPPLGMGMREYWEAEEARLNAPLAAPAPEWMSPEDWPVLAAAPPSWNLDSGQFWTIVLGELDPFEPCTHCATPEDGEPAHVGCPGCSCLCGLVEVVAV